MSGYPPRSGYDELDTTLMPPRPGEPYNRGSPGPSVTGSMSGGSQGAPVPPGQPGGQPFPPSSVASSGAGGSGQGGKKQL